MKASSPVISIVALAACLFGLVGCGQKTDCSGITFGSSGSTSGSSGGTSATGNSCGSSTGTGGTSGNGNVVDYLYIQDNTTIDAANFNGQALSAISGFVGPNLTSGGFADMMVVNGKYLYQPWVPSTGASGSPAIYAYVVGSGGTLGAVAGSPFATPTVADPHAVDPQGRFIFMAQNTNALVNALQVNSSTGALTISPGTPPALIDLAEQLVVDGSGQYLYVVLRDGGGVVQGFSIDQTTGDLTPLPGSPYLLGTSVLAAHPSGKFLIGLGSGELKTIAIDSSGNLSVAATVLPQEGPDELLILPNGNFLYTFTTPPSAIEGFAIDSSGNLTELASSPFSSLAGINHVKIDQAGTTMIGLTGIPQYLPVVVDPQTGALSEPATAYTGTASYVFGVVN